MFNKADGAVVDPTDGGASCDFCRWETLTAEDSFGRIEGTHAVSASNLFKYGIQHGLIVLRRHDPLAFTEPEIRDLLAVSAEWFRRAHADRPDCGHPLLIWNTLPRSGASQYHPHAQLLLSPVPFPMQERVDAAGRAGAEGDIFDDILRAHADLGLMRTVEVGGSTAHLIANLCPYKDMEVQVLGTSLEDPAFSMALHVALRTLIDRLGSRTFNVGVLNLTGDPALPTLAPRDTCTAGTGPKKRRPVFARVLSRGKIKSAASDFGGLEVIAGGSIGHTDPYVVFEALEQELAVRNLS